MLGIKIGADTSDLDRNLSQASRKVGEFSDSVAASAKSLALWASAAAAAGAAAITALVRNSMEAIDAQAKLARQLNATTVGLESVRRAADLSGVGADNVTAAMRRLDVQIGEAARGSNQAQETFARLGLSTAQLSKMDADQRIGALVQAINEQIPAAERAAVATELFGRQVGKAILEMDASAIAAARQEVEAFGLAVSEVDAATIERANDALSTIGEVVRGVGNRIAVVLAPYIEVIATKFKEAAIASNGWGSTVKNVIDGVIRAFGYVLNVIRGVQVAIKTLEVGFRAFGAGYWSLVSWIQKGFSELINLIIRGVNTVIRGINNISGLNIAEIALPFVNEYSAMMDSIAQTAVEGFRAAKEELHELAMTPLPSTMVDQFMADVQAAADAASKAQIAARGGVDVAGSPVAGKDSKSKEKEDKDAERRARELEQLRKSVADKITVMQEGFMTEEQLATLHFERQAALLQQARELEVIGQTEHFALLEALEQEHANKINAIREKSLTDAQRFQRMSWQQQTKTMLSELQNMTNGVSTHSRKMFEINKAVGIANAIVSAYEGISKTLAAYPYPYNIAMAAAHAATAFAQVNAIRSQSFGGGGGGAAPALAGSTAAPAVSNVGAGRSGQQSSGQIVNISLQGEIFGREQVRGLISQINEAVADGAVLRIA
jgi:hypothetical protein